MGFLCPTHGRRTPAPLYQVTPLLHLRALGVALLLGLLGGGALRLLVMAVPLLSFSLLGPLVLGAALGYLMAEGVSWGVGRKQGRGLQAIAAVGVALAMVLGLGSLALVSLGEVVGLLVGVAVAVGRLG